MEKYPDVLCAVRDGWCKDPSLLSSSLSRFSHSRLFDPNLIRIIDEFVAPLDLSQVCQIPQEYTKIHLIYNQVAYSSGEGVLTDTLYLLDVGTTLTLRATWRLSDQPVHIIGVRPWLRDEIIVFIQRFSYTEVWILDHQGRHLSQIKFPWTVNQAFAVNSDRGLIAQVIAGNRIVIYDARGQSKALITEPFPSSIDALCFHSVQDKIFVGTNGQVKCVDFHGHCLFQWSCSDNIILSMSCTNLALLQLVHPYAVRYYRQDDENGSLLEMLFLPNVSSLQSNRMFQQDNTLFTTKSMSSRRKIFE